MLNLRIQSIAIPNIREMANNLKGEKQRMDKIM